ncbi:MAG: N-acetylmuramoyl-L-alanine amidase [Muribaculaceae bacterium]|nr:N-acetylmuramoyl-L-alanine amidase [Muribaculaceae bacterium]
MRTIDMIIVHCTATPAGRRVSVADVDSWHRERGFDGIGYHYLIGLDGTVYEGRPIEKAGAHCLGKNSHSIGVCYVGGLDASMKPTDTRTPAQRRALVELLRQLRRQFPGAVIRGHRDFAAKDCPCFDATIEYSTI